MRLGYGLVLAVAFLAVGCGSGLIKPHGRVLKDGKPYPLKNQQKFWITFHPQFEPSDPFPATAMPMETTFIATGRKGKGIPPGKYKISVAVVNFGSESDTLGGAFGKDKSPFVMELLDDDEEIVLDLGKQP